MNEDLNDLKDAAKKVINNRFYLINRKFTMSDDTQRMLLISDIVEAVNAFWNQENYFDQTMITTLNDLYEAHGHLNDFREMYESCLKGIVPDCLGKAFVRLLFYTAKKNITFTSDFNFYIPSVSIEHRFTENCLRICKRITNHGFSDVEQIYSITKDMFELAKLNKIDLCALALIRIRYYECAPDCDLAKEIY